MKIHLIRHGQTYGTENRLYYGRTDLDLSEGGRRELRRFKEENIYPDVVYPDAGSFPSEKAGGADATRFVVSGLIRTVETLKILYGEVPYQTRPDLQEMHFGTFEMNSHQDLKETEAYRHWIGDIRNRTCPGGESIPSFARRVRGAWQSLLEEWKGESAEQAVVVIHGGVIAAIMDFCFGEGNPDDDFYRWIPDCGRGFTVETDRGFRPERYCSL